MVPYWRLSAYYFFYFAFIGAFSPYFTLYLKSLQLSAWDIGVLMSLMQVMRLLAPNLWGWLADRLGAKTPIVRGAALMSILGFSCFFFTQSFAGFFLGMALLAFFWSASLPLVEALTWRNWGQTDATDRPAVGLGRIHRRGDGPGAARCDRLPMLLWVCTGCSPASSPSPAGETPRPRRARAAGPALRRPAAVPSHRSFHVRGTALLFFIPSISMPGYDKTPGVSGRSAWWRKFLFIYMPRLLRNFLRASAGQFALAAALLLIGWAVDSLVLLLVAQIMHGATFGAFHAGSVAALNRWFAPQHQARVQAIYGSISFGAGGMLGGLVAGRAWESWGAELTFTLGAAFAAVGLILLWRGMPEPADAGGRRE
jgi:PPP family 3-phenylpropionic acid transporter